MLLSIALLLLCGLTMGALTRRLHLPAIVGMLLSGFLLGPYGLNLLSDHLLAISADLRRIALVIILMKAGLSLSLADLKRIGRPALLLCFLPATFEMIAFLLFAPPLLGVSLAEAGLLGAVMGAVSPAVVVPRMTRLIDEKRGTKKGIPQMLVAGASADDVYVIVLFSAMLTLAGGGSVSASDFLQIPEAILSGIALGAIAGLCFSAFFARVHIRDTVKLLLLVSVSLLLLCLEDACKGVFGFSGLLAVMTMCLLINQRRPQAAQRLCGKFSKLWVGAEVFLFVLVGATVNVQKGAGAGLAMLALLALGLLFRMAGTYLCVLGTDLTPKERLFCLFAELPKATVQAAIGGVPLAMGLPCGEMVLSFAVLAILLTAPAGAFAIDTASRWLEKEA